MTWNVLLTGPVDEAGPESLADIATITDLDEYEDRAALLEDADRFEAILLRPYEIDREFIERATNLEVIAKHGVGLDSVDIEAATEHGVVVCNTPGANARAVAEHSIGLLLAVRKSFLRADRDTRAGEWPRHAYIAHELGDDVLGVYGCGNIGSTVAEFARGLGMRTIGYDPYLGADEFPDGVEKVGSDELFERSDAVSVHAPLTDETRGAISAPELGALGERGIVVNAARGGVVDEGALVEALRDGTIAGAGLDVFEEEPPDPDDPLFDLDTVVVTPHVAGTTHEAARAKSLRAAENIRTVYEGGMPDSAVNADRL